MEILFDLHTNNNSLASKSKSHTMSDFDSLCAILNKKYGVTAELFVDASNSLKCIYFQDPLMKDIFNFYPDRLCIDFTYKSINLFLYIFSCSDTNGLNEIVSLALSMNEDAESFLWIMSTFKKHNPNYRKIKILAVDPEIKRCDDIRNIFPSPYLIICFHHAYKSFKKGLESLYAPNVFNEDPTKCAIELFKMMYNARNQAEYEAYYRHFLTLPSSVVFYFQEVWFPYIHLWRIGLDFANENIYTSLNVFLENLDNTFKLLFITEESLSHFIEKLFVILSLNRNEKKSLILYTDHALYSRFSAEYHICQFLTPFASKLVIDQLHLSSEIHMDCSVLSDNYYFDNAGSPVSASISMCQCRFYLYTLLPCRHIFAVRKTLSVNLFDEMLVDCTWTKRYYESSKKSLKETLSVINNLSLSDSLSNQKFVSEKLKNLFPSLYTSSPISVSRREILQQLFDSWKDNKEVYLEFDGIEPKFSFPDTICYTGTSGEYISSQPDTSQDKILPTSSHSNTIDSEKSARIIPSSSKFFKKQYFSTVAKNSHYVGSSDEDGLPGVSGSSYQRNNFNFKSQSLDGNHINFAFLCRIICGSKESIIDWLKQMELICTNMLCPTCGCGMTTKFVPRLSDGGVWICSNDMEVKKSCSRRCSVRRGSWFELTNMSFEQILTFCYMWIRGFSQSQIISETGISTATYISWNKLNRRVCEECLGEDENYSAMFKMDSTSTTQVLELWLQKHKEEDPFLKFLQDANSMHRKDAVKHSMG